jgi:hypothetical protein
VEHHYYFKHQKEERIYQETTINICTEYQCSNFIKQEILSLKEHIVTDTVIEHLSQHPTLINRQNVNTRNLKSHLRPKHYHEQNGHSRHL